MMLNLLTKYPPVKPKKPRYNNTEAKVQASILDWLKLCAPQVIVFHVPNGGHRDKRVAARLKWQGVVAGVPDLCCFDGRGYPFFIEVKSENGVLSSVQKEFIDKLHHYGIETVIARSIDDVRRYFQSSNIPFHESV